MWPSKIKKKGGGNFFLLISLTCSDASGRHATPKLDLAAISKGGGVVQLIAAKFFFLARPSSYGAYSVLERQTQKEEKLRAGETCPFWLANE